ncbi:MAG: BMC domain-containing protein [Clostridia bacterium]|nr:BMC domain-containing protein [Clostridia bacterium]MBQ2274088.1 BMC domain-containing protein [Clostridia bacterium]MBQ5798548.1 BMC domain-containing protein [Clostridia bacterium]MEE1278071.1 BMC domain-containing protein [Acutalibacteraceae bacterium]
MSMACGIIEVYGLVAALVACDAGCKAADVTVETFDKNKPGNPDELTVPLIVAVKFRGTVDNVTAAVEAAKIAANGVSGVVTTHILTSVEPDTEYMLTINAFDKN